MQNILQIIDYAAPYKGNFILSLLSLSKEIKPAKMVYLMPENASGLKWVGDFISDGNIVYFVEKSFFSKKVKIKNLIKILSIIKAEKIGIIHTHFVYHNFTIFLLKLCSSVKIISHLHNHYHIGGKFILLKKKVFDFTTDLFIGVSDSVSNNAQQEFGPAKVLSVRNAVDFSRLNNLFISQIKPNQQNCEILFFGWPYKRKGLDIAIKATQLLINEGKTIRLNIVLSGGIDIIKQEIKNEFGEIPYYLKFLPPTDAISEYYNSNDILLSASREEGFNYTLVEGAWSNCILIASNINGIPKDIPHIELFEPENASELKNTINTVMGWNPNEILRFKEEQKEYVKNEFSISEWAFAIAVCYRKLIQN